MKRIAFLFTQLPHGNSIGREGLDAVLATSALTDDITLFFISDGVFQLLCHQQPEKILCRNYINTFGLLQLYNINLCYLCTESIQERGLDHAQWVIPVKQLTAKEISKSLLTFSKIITF